MHLEERSFCVWAGDLGENITSSGLDLEALPEGGVELGRSAAVELTGLRTPCGLIGRWQAGLKRLDKGGVPPIGCGVMGIVRMGGAVSAGD
jgi:MOSC domain-containing protein YiiM